MSQAPQERPFINMFQGWNHSQEKRFSADSIETYRLRIHSGLQRARHKLIGFEEGAHENFSLAVDIPTQTLKFSTFMPRMFNDMSVERMKERDVGLSINFPLVPHPRPGISIEITALKPGGISHRQLYNLSPNGSIKELKINDEIAAFGVLNYRDLSQIVRTLNNSLT